MANNYIDNKKMYLAISEYFNKVNKCKEENKDKPKIPDYIGSCFMLIAKRLSTKPNFIGYSYRDEMIADGIENCILAIDNFDPSKSNNPFAYFTQIIYFAFLRRIAKEKKQEYIKNKTLQKMYTSGELASQEFEDFKHIDLTINTEYMNNLIETVELNHEKKKKIKNKPKGVEKYYAEE